MKLWFALVAALSPAIVLADTPFCDQMHGLMEQGPQTLTAPTPATCSTSLSMTGARDRNCYWAFSYRSNAAQTAFADVLAEVTACLGGDPSLTIDQSVNHPDAYDLRTLESDGLRVAVSLKDKGALGQTLVFLRVPVGD